jgi:hypothetical protein
MPNVISPASIERMLPWKLTGQVSRMVGLSASVSGFLHRWERSVDSKSIRD